MVPSDVEPGLGLVSLGRSWGFRPRGLPTAAEASRLLQAAVALGIRFFDTAPAYGVSEEILGDFLRSLRPEMRSRLIIATKCGEEWIGAAESTVVDHSYETLCRSVDRSLSRLSTVELLQVHKASVQVLTDEGVRRALGYARSRGITAFGASVTDLEAAHVVLSDPLFSYLQFPFNFDRRELEPIFHSARKAGRRLIVNRPFAMGSLLYDRQGKPRGKEALQETLRFILRRRFHGVVLFGTSSEDHLREVVEVFRKEISDLP
jgi:aryl-alcohol dehydrogenase-like predicted oxidoreductase